MSVATLRSEAPPGAARSPALARIEGRAEITFGHAGGATRLVHLYQSAPLRVLFPDVPRGEIVTAQIVNTAGGVVGGDRLDLRVVAGPGTSALAAQQAAEKIYRSDAKVSRITVGLEAEDGAWLEYLPQETIIFDGARLRRATAIDFAPGARVLAGEMLVLGRIARGERINSGLIHDSWEVRRGGRLVWADALHLGGDIAADVDAPGGFGGAVAMAGIVYAADDAADRRDLARQILDAGAIDGDIRAGATVVGGILIIRWLARDAQALRQDYGRFWARFRAEVGGHPARLPRLWQI